LPPNPTLAVLPQSPHIDTSRTYGLAQLIDIAQRNNPTTRISWEHARSAALTVGMAEATYLPMITANVIGGRQTVKQSLPIPIGAERYFETNLEGISPFVAFQWLVFDFGQRMAVADAAKQGAIASNVLFTGAHQKLIFDVTRSYYLYAAAVMRVRIAREALSNSIAIRRAAEERLSQGLATTVEVAQARQQVAQSELRVVQAEGQERDAYQAVITAMGVNPLLKLRIKVGDRRAFPRSANLPIEAMVKLALSQRPDVAASYSTMLASQAGIRAAEAEFMPKVYVAGSVGSGQSGFNVNGLPTIGQQASGTGFLVGATVPIYDSGLRAAQLEQARSRAKSAQVAFERTQTVAVTEIVAASNALRTALASYHASNALAAAAATTHKAAVAAYKNGLGTITTATAADTALLDARQAQADAHAAVLVSAANLAFVVGAMTSGDVMP
jgi:outer membrane protein TolC